MPTSLTEVNPTEGARRVALAYLAQAHRASRHLDDPDEPEALHAFRVGMRRLRSCLRAYAPILGDTLGGKLRRQVKKIASATNPGRDAEVQLRWALELGRPDDPAEAPGVTWLAGRLEAQRDEAYAHARDALLERFDALEKKLRRRLQTYTVERVVGEDEPSMRFGAVAAAALALQAHALREDLAQVKGVEDEAIAHRARIHGKRLRYLLEPFATEVPSVKPVVKRLKGLQDLLGDLNDLHNLNDTLGRALEDSALARAKRLREEATAIDFDLSETLARDERAGLLAMLQRVQAGRRDGIERLLRDWLAEGGALEALLADVDGVMAELRGPPPPPVEIERKLLLRELPPACREVEPATIDQGYLPGRTLIERVRRIRDGRGERYRRTVKYGAGIRRVELEEECDRAVFEALWALTQGRRVRKRRYRLPEGELVWEVDAFDDRELTLAEVELPHEDHEVTYPEWLAPYVVRDVTDEPEFVNARLAK